MDDLFYPLPPSHFFEIGASCHYLKQGKEQELIQKELYLLPDTSLLTLDPLFADVFMGWNETGLFLKINVHKPFEKTMYPHFQDGDSIELFLDTRDGKRAGGTTRFCHHFFFLPESYQGKQAAEITRFRGEDKHDLCKESLLGVSTTFFKSSYELNIFIPENSLFGYDPIQFKRLGFTYRICAPKGVKQHFSAVSSEYPFEGLPQLWSSLHLETV